MTNTHTAAADVKVLNEAADLIDQFAAYSDEMRKIGRGMYYRGPLGNEPTDIALMLRGIVNRLAVKAAQESR